MKKGFTLAETLITLGIIGVVAAITIPVLNLSTKEKAFEARLKVSTSDLENAFTTMMATEGAGDMNETVAIGENKIVENLEKYLKIYTDDTETNNCTLKNGAELNFRNLYNNGNVVEAIKNRDGEEINDAVADVVIDVNGSDPISGKPNTEYIDKFRFAILSTGLLEEAQFSNAVINPEPTEENQGS